jgi:hypothetical protein
MSGKIFCFSWNAGGLSLCRYNKRGGFKSFIAREKCVPVTFMETKKMNEILFKCDVAVFSTEDELASGSYFHSDYLPKFMVTQGFNLLVKAKADSDGELADITGVFGTKRARVALRLSIYVHPKAVDKYEFRKPVINVSTTDLGDMGRHSMSAININVQRISKISLDDRYVLFRENIIIAAVALGTKTVLRNTNATDNTTRQIFIDDTRTFIGTVFPLGDIIVPTGTGGAYEFSNVLLLGDFGDTYFSPGIGSTTFQILGLSDHNSSSVVGSKNWRMRRGYNDTYEDPNDTYNAGSHDKIIAFGRFIPTMEDRDRWNVIEWSNSLPNKDMPDEGIKQSDHKAAAALVDFNRLFTVPSNDQSSSLTWQSAGGGMPIGLEKLGVVNQLRLPLGHPQRVKLDSD